MSLDVETVKLLQQLDNSQTSVENTSQWFLDNKEVAKDLVKFWFKEFRKAPQKKKIAFLHVANDIIQKGIVCAPQYGKLFEPVLPTAFKETAKIQRHSIRASVAHLLIVWATRRLYSKNFLRQLRFICQRAVAETDIPDANEETKRNIIAASPFAFSFSSVVLDQNAPLKELSVSSVSDCIKTSRKRTHISSSDTTVQFNTNTSDTVNVPRDSITAIREDLARELQTETIEPPTIAQLIQSLEFLQSAASSDAATRREIAQFPPEVSDFNKAVEFVNKAEGLERDELVKKVSQCATRLDEYNELLEGETTIRNQLALQMKAFHSHIFENITKVQEEMKELKLKLEHGQLLNSTLKKHISNLPDVTLRLDPLPTVGDLFG